jgi:uncharacterized membrane protein YfcA
MALAVLATLVGAAVQSATGFGFALVLSPVLFAVLEPGEAVTVLFVLSALLSLLVLVSERRDSHVLRGPVAALLAWSLPGLAAGALILSVVSKPPLQVAVGVAVVVALLVQLRVDEPHGPAAGWHPAAAGVTTGLLSTTTGVSGPPLLIWLERLGATPDQTRDTLAASFLGLTIPSAAALLAVGKLGVGGVSAFELVALLAAVALGRALGRQAFVRFDRERFRQAALAVALLAGVGSIVAGLAA